MNDLKAKSENILLPLKVSRELRNKFKQECAGNEVSMSAVVRGLIKEYIQKKPQSQ